MTATAARYRPEQQRVGGEELKLIARTRALHGIARVHMYKDLDLGSGAS